MAVEHFENVAAAPHTDVIHMLRKEVVICFYDQGHRRWPKALLPVGLGPHLPKRRRDMVRTRAV